MTHWEKNSKAISAQNLGTQAVWDLPYSLMWEEVLVFLVTTHLMTVPLSRLSVCLAA